MRGDITVRLSIPDIEGLSALGARATAKLPSGTAAAIRARRHIFPMARSTSRTEIAVG